MNMFASEMYESYHRISRKVTFLLAILAIFGNMQEASILMTPDDTASILSSELDLHWDEDVSDVDHRLMSEEDYRYSHYFQKDEEKGALIVCNSQPHLCGYDRRLDVRRALGKYDGDGRKLSVNVLYNQYDRTCFSVYEERADDQTSLAQILRLSILDEIRNGQDSYITYSHVNPLMKIRANAVDKFLFAEINEKKQFPSLHVTMCSLDSPLYDNSSEIVEGLKIFVNAHNLLNDFDKASKHGETAISDVFHKLKYDAHKRSDSYRASVWNEVLNNLPSKTSNCAIIFDNLMILEDEDFDFVVNFDDALRKSNDKNIDTIKKCAIALTGALASESSVCSVDVVGSFTISNDNAQWIVQSGEIDFRPWFDVGLTGSGQVVAISDSGLDTNNCYFYDASPGENRTGVVQLERRKVVYYDNWQDDTDAEDGHGTHISGTIAGRKSIDGIMETTGVADGIARDAKLSFFDLGEGEVCCQIPGANKIIGSGRDSGARIHNASWGGGSGDTEYTSFSLKFDRYLHENDDTLMVVANGNFGNIVEPANAKNVLSVGATQSDGRDLYTGMKGKDYLAYFSASGPAHDERIKPDLVAPGFSILSASARGNMVGECDPDDLSLISDPGVDTEAFGLSYKAGTSMAAGVVSGTAALVRQYFMEGWHPNGIKESSEGFDPSAALVKAVLINGAQDVTGKQEISGSVSVTEPYDYMQGFGRINLLSSLPLQTKTDFSMEIVDRQPIQPGEVHEFVFTINQCESTELSVTLVWTDSPTSAGCTTCLVNDLDLLLIKNEQKYYPNGLSSADSKDNVERIRVSVNESDSLAVEVRGTNLAEAQQKYSLIVTGCLGNGEVTLEPYASPSISPTGQPTKSPLTSPSISSTGQPTKSPLTSPSISPTRQPTKTPLTSSSISPTRQPTKSSSIVSSTPPSPLSTNSPTQYDERQPTKSPTRVDEGQPTKSPTRLSSGQPSMSPVQDLKNDDHLNEIMTTYFATTKQDGIMFEIHAIERIQIHALVLNFAAPATQSVEVYVKDGPFAGFEDNFDESWDWIGIDLNRESSGHGKKFYLANDLFEPFEVQKDHVVSLYVASSSGNLLCADAPYYRSLTTYNSDLKLYSGVGIKYVFGDISHDKCAFSGIIKYSTDQKL